MWEHKVIFIDGIHLASGIDYHRKMIQQALTNASSAGWELVSTNFDSNTNDTQLFFKRPAQQQ